MVLLLKYSLYSVFEQARSQGGGGATGASAPSRLKAFFTGPDAHSL